MGIIDFQAFSWSVDDGTPEEDDYENMDFTVHVFGKTRTGESVAVHVSGFSPSFCVLFPRNLSTPELYDELEELLKKQLKLWDVSNGKPEEVADYSDHLVDIDPDDKIWHKKSLWGFTHGATHPFFRYVFRSRKAHDKLKNLIRACHKNVLSEDEMESFYDEVKGVRKASKRNYEAGREQVDTLISQLSGERGVPERALRWILKLGDASLPFGFAKGKLFEVIDPILRFAHLRNLKMAGWIRLSDPIPVPEGDREATCRLEYRVQYDELHPLDCDDICPKIKELAFDIEAYSYNDQFPDPSIQANCAFQISVTLKDYASPQIRRILLHLRSPEDLRGEETGRCGPIKDTEVMNFETEKELLETFANIIVEEDPDILYGYNSDSFDWNYLMVRAQMNHCEDKFGRISRIKEYVCKVESKAFQSSAYGDNKYLRVDIPGRLNVDLMIWVQRNKPPDKYPSYALDVVAETEIGQNKHDVDYKDIFAAYRTGIQERCTEVGDYCCQDAVLVQKLCIKMDVLTQMFEMSNITDTPPMYLLQKGQQIKVFSQIAKKALQKGFLVPLADDRDEGSFTGAIVLEPDIGQYLTPVAVLDFASLYPSIQVAYQVCYSTIVLVQCRNCKVGEAPCLRSRGHACMDNLPGIEYVTIEWDDEVYVFREASTRRKQIFKNIDEAKKFSPKKDIVANIARNDPNEDITWRLEKIHHRYRFAQGQPSVIPDLQVELKKNRKAVRRMMGPLEHSKDPEDQLRYRVLNGRQLAIKVSMNSIYGFTSAFMLNLMALSAAVTAKGRQMIEQTRTFMETRFESLAFANRWTKEDTCLYYDKAGREVSSETPEEGWIRKFPTAVEGKPWAEKPLKIHVVGGDTDSVFCNFPESSLAEVISLCHKAEVILTNEVFNRPPIEMEYEKTYLPMIIQKKKNYIGLKYEMDDLRWSIDFKGIAVKRRNYAPLVKRVCWNVMHPALGVEPSVTRPGKFDKVSWDFREGPDRAIVALRESLECMIRNEVSIDDLVITASLKSHYKSENLPHIQLAKRMKERDAGSAPQSGQRFGFVYVNEESRGNELWAKTEDPSYAKAHNLAPDYLFYLDNQIRKPVVKFLSLIGKKAEAERVFEEVQKILFDQIKAARRKLEAEARSSFFPGTKRKAGPVAPLKPPKKPTVTKGEKRAKQLAGTTSLKEFFGTNKKQ